MTSQQETYSNKPHCAVKASIEVSPPLNPLQEPNGVSLEDSTVDIAQMLGMMDPWYERNVLNLLSLSSDVLCQVPSVLSGPHRTRTHTTTLHHMLNDKRSNRSTTSHRVGGSVHLKVLFTHE